jgi:hypothetical protein
MDAWKLGSICNRLVAVCPSGSKDHCGRVSGIPRGELEKSTWMDLEFVDRIVAPSGGAGDQRAARRMPVVGSPPATGEMEEDERRITRLIYSELTSLPEQT